MLDVYSEGPNKEVRVSGRRRAQTRGYQEVRAAEGGL